MNLEQDLFGEDTSPIGGKRRKSRMSEHELEDLREHIDVITFNLGKVYQHAKDRTRKQSNRSSVRKKFQNSAQRSNSYNKSTGD